MRIVLNPTGISPHQLPLARAIVKRIGAENFRYVCQGELEASRVKMGWNNEVSDSWVLRVGEHIEERMDWLENADVLISCIRNVNLFERRSRKGLKTYYSSERWFKPPIGRLRMLFPRFYRLAKRMVRLAQTDTNFRMLPVGVHAAADYKWVGVPESKMMTWGYFVEPSSRLRVSKETSGKLRVLWVGRMLKLKNVDILIRAIRKLNRTELGAHIELTLVGDGPEKTWLAELAQGLVNVSFQPSVKIEAVRDLMRTHDVYVFPSNGYDGWGAVVSEALEEGMIVVGSNQAGAPATLLPEDQRFDCRDVQRLANLLQQIVRDRVYNPNGQPWLREIGMWSAAAAAERLWTFCQEKEMQHA